LVTDCPNLVATVLRKLRERKPGHKKKRRNKGHQQSGIPQNLID